MDVNADVLVAAIVTLWLDDGIASDAEARNRLRILLQIII